VVNILLINMERQCRDLWLKGPSAANVYQYEDVQEMAIRLLLSVSFECPRAADEILALLFGVKK